MVKKASITSQYLSRTVHVDIYTVDNISNGGFSYKLLLFNDGQDLLHMKFDSVLSKNKNLFSNQNIIVVGIHPKDRLQEYGTSGSADYKGRGREAKAYTQFISEELIPHLQQLYSIEKGIGIAGFSLGGLSAFDIALHKPSLFDKVGVFSGSFWWRSKDFKAMDPDANRIVIEYLRGYKAGGMEQQYWFQTGELDEESDRNNNGVIDSIDDTMDVIASLKQAGIPSHSIQYLEVKGGTHSVETWKGVMPEFLRWWVEE